MTPGKCGVVGELEVGRRVCQLGIDHDGYHHDGDTHWSQSRKALDATGGPAFPTTAEAQSPRAVSGGGHVIDVEMASMPGMTLADWYAGQALAMLGPAVAGIQKDKGLPLLWIDEAEVVKCARRIGRAMVAAKAAGQ